MLKSLFGLIALAAVALATIAGVTYYTAPDYFRSQLALLAPPSGPTAYLVLELDAAYLRQQWLEHVADQMTAALRNADPPIRTSGRGVVDDRARVRLVDPSQMPRARRVLAGLANAAEGATDTLALVEHEDGLIEARLPFAIERDNLRLATSQAIEVITSRLNPTGRLPITVTASGDSRILVEARGETDSGRLRALIGPTGLLSFHMVREVIGFDPAERLPAGTMLAQPYPNIGQDPEVVERRAGFTGERILRAFPSADPQTGQFVLTFQLDAQGTRLFCRITREHQGERFAVLLDSQVITAPRINEPICAGSGQISGNFTRESVNELAMLLHGGALPAPLVVVEEGLRQPPPR
jgi:protein-export membrane protein SecD